MKCEFSNPIVLNQVSKHDLDEGHMYFGVGEDSDLNCIYVRCGKIMVVLDKGKEQDAIIAVPLSAITKTNAYPTKFVRCSKDTQVTLVND